ncbi:MAG: GNAT family N-acetyltransferase [Anaerolineales bacterium]|nr:GNAT family N-acetyltransferase [Anaerolineales bacterium]
MQLETSKLILREYSAHDLAAILAYQTHPAYLRYYPWSRRTRSQVESFLHQLIEWQTAQPRLKFQLAVELKETRELIGSCGLRKSQDTSFEGELGYEIDPHYWGLGYATEAVETMVKFGFDTLQLHRVFASVIANNIGSRRVLEKLGFTYEGQLRENQRFKDRWWDTALFGLLKHEWDKIL